MQKIYSYNYFLKKRNKEAFLKKISFASSILLMLQMSLGSLFFTALPLSGTEATTGGNICSAATDVVLVMDRSGSMGDETPSNCEWENLEWVTNTNMCVHHQQNGLTLPQCQAMDDNKPQCPFGPVYTSAVPTKISGAKQAANNFVSLMGPDDQSALVSYANSATLDKQLSNNHPLTQTAINSLVTNGATDIGDAISFGFLELKSSRSNPQAVKAMILLTDGKANKPDGPGNGEYAPDVAYAVSKATEAAGYGYKIFTIGLGSNGDINETMLQSIANATGAQYFHAPTQADLQSIYNSIATKLCQYGSVSGCKYSDTDDDGDIADETVKLSGWPIILNNSESLTQLTDENGCYKFSGLLAGAYTISEGAKAGTTYLQTYPAAKTYSITLTEGQNIINKDFGNYLAVCGNGKLDSGEECDDGNIANGDGCSNQCVLEPKPICGDGQVNQTSEQCDQGVSNGLVCTAAYGQTCNYCTSDCQTVIVPGPSCGDGIINDDEQCDGYNATCTTAAGYSGVKNCDTSCHLGECTTNEFCGDGIKNGSETCDDGCNNGKYGFCDASCTSQTLPVCGNGIKEASEECDGSAGVGDHQSCSSDCQLIDIPYCGDNIVNNNETCDSNSTACTTAAGYTGTKNCTDDCAWEDCATDKYCGDGLVNGLEQCDPNNPFSIPAHYTCTSLCVLEQQLYCGDGQLNSSEVCEVNDSRACSTEAGYKGIQNCQSDCTGWDACVPQESCGDGIINDGEQCDGNNMSCTTSDGYSGVKNCDTTCNLGCCTTSESCGDGIKNGLETCDNGTNNGQFGFCNANCTGLTRSFCGNSVKEGTEECDETDGVGAHQSCSTDCKLINVPYCGDGTCHTNENCETCVVDCGSCGGGPICNDGNLDPGEVCDDGLAHNGQYGFCNALCSGFTPGSIISGYKYSDPDGLASTTDGRVGLSGWEIQLFGSSSTSTILAATTTASNGFFQFLNLAPGAYSLSEIIKSGWTQIMAPSSSIMVLLSQSSINNNFVNFNNGGSGGPETFCGDGIKQSPNDRLLGGPNNDGLEQCDGSSEAPSGFVCTQNCVLQSTGGGGSGGGGSNLIFLLNNQTNNTGATASSTTTTPENPIVLGETGVPKLTITKTVNTEFANPGDKNIEYRVRITNIGNLTAFKVVLSDILPDGLAYSDTGKNDKTWEVGDLKAGEAKDIVYFVDVKDDATPQTYINTATARAINNGPVAAQAELFVKPVKVLAASGFDKTEFAAMAALMILLVIASAILKRRTN